MTETTEKTETAEAITLNDFIIAVNVIDACSERGAFKGNELSSVGELREKFALFVKQNAPAPVEGPEQTDLVKTEGGGV
jgi:hypothetical protein